MNRKLLACVTAAALLLVQGCASTTESRKPAGIFDLSMRMGATPSGWTPGESNGDGRPSRWSIESDATSPGDAAVLTCRTSNPGPTFNWCVHDAAFPADVEASVSLRALSGVDDQGGGIVFRFQDGANYYLTRWNPLEKNVRLYHVKDGVRRMIGDAHDDVSAEGWKTLGVKAVGDRLTVRFEGRTVIETTDATFPNGGKVGLWTKADATTSFDLFAAVSP